MGLFSRLKKATGLEGVREPCVQPKPKDSPIMPDDRQPVPVGAVEADGGRKEAGRKQKSFWKWPVLLFPSHRIGTYDLGKAEEKFGIEAGTHWRDSNGQSVHEVCVQPKCTPITSENHHPNPSDEAPVDAFEADGGRMEARREEKKNFWKWPALHFPCHRTGTYDLAKAEKKYGIELGTHWRDSDAPAPEVLPAAEEQQKQDVHEPCVQPKDTPTRSDEVPETDGGRAEAGREEVLLTAEEQLIQDILDKGHIRKQYNIGHKLGEGGCGSVYEGTRCKDGLKVAVKCSKKMPDMPSIKVPGYHESFPLEIGLMLMANKGPSVPQIIKLLDWEDDTDHYMMVMERPVPCMDLFSFVNHHGGSLDERTAWNIMRQVIDAAKMCCERAVFHRDIKLENLLVNQDTMEVKLIDFGCSALMKKPAFKVFHGTREYCPPEFNRYHAKPTTVWTLGFILYEMLCGECPTSYDRHMITVNLWTRPGLSKECCQMICDCLQPDPQKRLSLDKMHLHDWFKVTE